MNREYRKRNGELITSKRVIDAIDALLDEFNLELSADKKMIENPNALNLEKIPDEQERKLIASILICEEIFGEKLTDVDTYGVNATLGEPEKLDAISINGELFSRWGDNTWKCHSTAYGYLREIRGKDDKGETICTGCFTENPASWFVGYIRQKNAPAL